MTDEEPGAEEPDDSPSGAGVHASGPRSASVGTNYGTVKTGDEWFLNVVPGTRLDHAAVQLASGIRARLEREIGRRKLHSPEPIRVRWSRTGRPVQARAEVLGLEQHGLRGDVTEISALIRTLPKRQAVVLGKPGSGKSVLALLLARDLLSEPRPDQPVPVLLSLSSWRPRITLRSWMVRRIAELQPELADRREFGRNAVARLVDAGRVMPVLDGLDELPRELHAHAIEAIEQTVGEGVPLLVTCRTTEYEESVKETGGYLTKAAVIELEPVEYTAAISFLDRSQPAGQHRWDPVFDHLRAAPESVLGRALSKPLMLDLARAAYRSPGTDPGELTKIGSQDRLESHLLERFVPTVYAEDPGCRYRPGKARRWLAFIARQMQAHDTVDFAWWQIESGITGLLGALVYGAVGGWFVARLWGADAGVVLGGLAALLVFAARRFARAGIGSLFLTDDAPRGLRSVLFRYLVLDVLLAGAVAALIGFGAWSWLRGEVRAPSDAVRDLSIALAAGVGCASLFNSPWGSYQVSRAWLGLTNQLPWRLMRFLDDAHDRGVLRQTGVVHQFRHIRLREELSGSLRKPGPYKGAADAVNWSTRSQLRRKILLFAMPPAVQLWTLSVGLVAIIFPTLFTADDAPLDYSSGDRPLERVEYVCADVGPDSYSPSCTEVRFLDWRLRTPHSVQRTDLKMAEPKGGTKPISAFAGRLEATGCAGASIEVTMIVQGMASRFVMAAGDADRAQERTRLPRPVEPVGVQASTTLRRLDQEPCETQLSWRFPGVHFDDWAGIRQRLEAESRGAS
ncbi:NACHT domain-containing protein [Actinomadura livida]|uniref:NACHT domain-containing protein n=1 Tax=Actinomadura livida TaxID=79909 RepID=A0A7W7IC92_9ACTN|nr:MULTISPECIES: NACHT domain-containing protein [Actinomadura]MBB4774388.1 hypothetical protein [Actinomadura catellatispora]GGT82914.1 hypothetical protein GCM10010208_01610 [Actinomadura livida]